MLPVMALSTRNGGTEWNVSLQVEIRFIRKKVGKFVAAEDFDTICFPLKGPDFFSHTTFVVIQARRHRPPRSPTREDSHRLWVFPASALTLVLAGTYTLRITPGDSDHP
ncbi:hypothetical protein AVEN_148259-1 [Araneus ventricosus]|uniref:Uncharacterized protein n=1 Tax=Araneus ventricosus TaxID=182803 RepID=A0A4Y2TQ15_ARAVE|nr:hypothetical protein AVEN_148259-1 [Araneus ventricosus]